MQVYDFKCFTCERKFDTRSARDLHCYQFTSGHEAPPFECPKCGFCSTMESKVIDHQLTINHLAHQCSLCDEKFFSKEECWEHELTEHFYCKSCDKTFLVENNMRMHMRSQKHMAKNIACPACERLFTTKAIAMEHVENGFCLYAPRARKHSLYEYIYKFHPQLTTGDPPIPLPDPSAPEHAVDGGFKCPECSNIFKMKIGLKDHIESSVHRKRRYKCPTTTCDKRFSTAADLWKHFNIYRCAVVGSGEEHRLWREIIAGAATI